MIVGISNDRVSSVWHHAAPLLKRAFDRVDYAYNMEEISGQVHRGDMQLWMTHDMKAAALTKIVMYPRFSVLKVVAIGGEGVDEWFTEADSLMTGFATHHGCKYIEASGRRGWEKIAEGLGYSFGWITLRKEV